MDNHGEDSKNLNKDKANMKKKKKKKSIKVVYISNPVKVNTSANEFRALVQELTGRDGDPLKYATIHDIEDRAEEYKHAINGGSHASSLPKEEVNKDMDLGECKREESSIEMIENFAVFSPPMMFCDPAEYFASGFHDHD